MTTIKLTKMQGCGNDFVIIDYEEYEKTNMPMSELAKKVCDRNFGVGADGMIIPRLVEAARQLNAAKQLGSATPQAQQDDIALSPYDISWYFYNSDGSTAQMCGNGIRCFAKYVYDKKLLDKKTFSVLTGAGIIKPELLDDGNVKVNMGTPILEDEKIPFKGNRKIQILDKEFDITPVSMGNPHCVIFTDNNPMEDAKKYGPYIEKHEYFPEKTNTEFVRIKSRSEIDLCVYERGCGITLACGTGACASVVAGVLNNLTEDKVKVNLPGGTVFIDWQGSTAINLKDIYMTGPANYSFVADYML
jgi:diaminopimelate epimerase